MAGAVILVTMFESLKRWLGSVFRGGPGGGTQFLCDSCKYDYGSACKRPERPNAVRCPDYRRS